jgi:RNA polymerase sigma-70 factor (ECF subfamily)
VQETLLRALANIDSFQPGSNLAAWLFTILRNLFRSDYRKRRREVEDADGSYAKTLKTQPAQSAHLEFEEFRAALDKLPQDQREALILVGASGFSYEDAAAICGCAVGTIKSRVNRARSKLSALLYVDGAEDFGPDETVRAVSAVAAANSGSLGNRHSGCATWRRPECITLIVAWIPASRCCAHRRRGYCPGEASGRASAARRIVRSCPVPSYRSRSPSER